MADVSPTLASVLQPDSDALASWSKLGDHHRLSQLRLKFWGKKIEDETREWRISHPTVKNDVGNDIGPDCYALDLGIKLKCAKLWVRQEYKRIYDYCVEQHAEGPTSEIEMARSVVITGYPGVGRSYWVTYAVRRRLGEQKPFLWYRDGYCFLFVEDGVFKQDVETISSADFAPFLWAFVDADTHPTGVPEKLAGLYTNLYIIFTTTPERQRWYPLTQSTDCAKVLMDTWSIEEIRQAAEIHGFTNEQKSRAEDLFENRSPSPRICINFVKYPILYSQYLDRSPFMQ